MNCQNIKPNLKITIYISVHKFGRLYSCPTCGLVFMKASISEILPLTAQIKVENSHSSASQESHVWTFDS